MNKYGVTVFPRDIFKLKKESAKKHMYNALYVKLEKVRKHTYVCLSLQTERLNQKTMNLIINKREPGEREMGGNGTSLRISFCIVLTFGNMLIFYIFKK